jgi:hypothetical protein
VTDWAMALRAIALAILVVCSLNRSALGLPFGDVFDFELRAEYVALEEAKTGALSSGIESRAVRFDSIV